MNYYFRSINPLDREWSLFKQKKGSVTIYYGHSQMIPDDIVLLYIGKQDADLISGVYAIGKVVSDVWRDEDDRYCVKIKLLTHAIRNQPIIPENEAALYKGNIKSVRNTFKVTENIGKLSKRIEEILFEDTQIDLFSKKNERNILYDPINIDDSIADSKELIMPHQSNAVEAMNNYFCLDKDIENRNGLVIMPTGSGKTYTTVTWLLKYGITKGYRVVWLVHRQELVEQTFHEFRNQAPLLKGTGIKKLRIFPISGAHLHMSMACRADIYVCSIASVANKYGYRFIERMLGTAGKRKVIVVIDEAHHSVAGNYQKVIKRITKLNPNRILLGLTATPKRLNEAEHKQLMRMYHVDTNIINHIGQHGYVYEVTLKQLLESGFLAEPYYERVDTEIIGEIEYKCTPEDEMYYNQYGDLSERIKRQIAKSSARNEIILNQYMRNKERYGKTLIFAVNQLHAETLCDVFKKAGISCDYVVSSRPGSQDIIRDFKDNKFNVLINVQILTEGSDVPDVQTVFLTRETNSDSLLMQMIGRGLRGVKAGGTEVAYIVAFHDTWDTFNDWLDPKEFIDIDGSVTITDENEEDENEEIIEVVPKQEDEIEEIDEIENGISDEDIYRTLYMKLYGSIKANICSKEDFSAFPIGWYSLVNEEGENISLLVYDEQKACYEDIGANRELVRNKLDVESFVDIYFACSSVKPDLEELAYFLDYLDETGELPPYFSFEERDFFSPNKIAEKMNSLFEKEEEKEAWLKELFKKNRILQEIYKYFYPFKKTVFDVCKKKVEAEIATADEREQYEIIPNYYDLQELISEVLHMYPKLKADGLIKLSWSEKVVREWFALCQKYDDDSNLYQIHVNKLLSSSKVSRELIKYLLFHELLHQNGYWNHDSEFRRLEWQYPNSAELDGELDSLWLFYNMDEQYKDSVRFEMPEFIVNSNEEQNQNSHVPNNSNYNKNASGIQEGYKYCRNCGNKLPTNAKFCDKCGSSTDY